MESAPQATGSSDTHQKLLVAAARVFARDGLEGATTRQIAREAGVNEVTLFPAFSVQGQAAGGGAATHVRPAGRRRRRDRAGADANPVQSA